MTHATDIRGWTYDADTHCTPCTRARFGAGVTDAPWPDRTARDSEGNTPHPIFESDEVPEFGETCGTCGQEISEP